MTGPVQRLAGAPRWLLSGAVRGYRYWLKPWLGNVCRFEPSCSAYALEALKQHGAAAGTVLTVGRILRCHPWCQGGHDPVPERFAAPGTGLFTRLLAQRPTAVPELHDPSRKHP